MATRLKRERLAREWPQWKLAAAANIHPFYVSQYERRLMAASPLHRERLARALGLAVSDLFDRWGFAIEAELEAH